MPKILYSHGFGAGWSSWESDPALARFMLTYQPFIDRLERGEKIPEPDYNYEYSPDSPKHWLSNDPDVIEFIGQCHTKFGAVPYLGGIEQLCVEEVNGPFRIDEYDGSENVVEAAAQEWIVL